MKTILPSRHNRQNVVTIIRRRWRIVALAVTVAMICASTYLFYTPPVFTATTLLLLEPIQQNILYPDTGSAALGSNQNARIESQIEILKSDAVALATIRSLALQRSPDFAPKIRLTEKLKRALGANTTQQNSDSEQVYATLDALKDVISVRRMGLTYAVAVSASSREPAQAAWLANGFVQTFIDLQVRADIAANETVRSTLQARFETAFDALGSAEVALDNLTARNVAVFEQGNPTPGLTGPALQSVSLNQKLQDIARLREGALFQNTINATPDEGREAPNTVALRSPEVSKLPPVTVRKPTGSLPAVLRAELYQIQQESLSARSQYRLLLSRLRTVEAQAFLQVGSVRIISPALTPRYPTSPNAALILVLTLFGSLGVGFGLVVLKEGYTAPSTNSV